MTAKEKATELVEKYQNVDILKDWDGMYETLAIQCAKIAVHEIIDEVIHLQEESEGVYGATELFTRHNYWHEVKQELEKM